MRLFFALSQELVVADISKLSWRPTASIEVLKQRARLLAQVRNYFAAQGVWEVETPVLSHFAGTDLNLEQWQTTTGLSLHTSPEFAMKRLLAAGSGDVYQVCHAFRRDEAGTRHNPEFTMLEWYREGMDEHALMQDVTALIRYLSSDPLQVSVKTYSELFQQNQLPHPLLASDEQLKAAVATHLGAAAADWMRDDCLDALMALVIEPSLQPDQLTFVHQYPPSQAALARHLQTEHGPVARRFELYWRGMELANGYFELTDAVEQAQRFAAENAHRQQQGKVIGSQDEHLLQALAAGLPSCAGVALGLDRLFMALLGKNHIKEVIAFPFDRA